MQGRQVIYLSIVLLSFLSLFLFFKWRDLSQKNSVSVYGYSGSGLQLFYKMAKELRENDTLIDRKSLWLDRLPTESIFFILSPKKEISSKTIEVLSRFVKGGGRLILSFKTKQEAKSLNSLLKALDGPRKILKNKEFKNKKASLQSPDRDYPYLRKNSKYAFYSPYWISGKECLSQSFSCYFRHWSYGKGDIFLMAGLPIFSNALLELADNRYFAFHLIAEKKALFFDEYHHFYSDHTFAQLLMQPSFGIPLFAIVLCVCLFFLFAYNRFNESKIDKASERPLASFHQFNEAILSTKLKSSIHAEKIISQHQSFLEKKFPYAKEEIRDLHLEISSKKPKDFLQCAQSLVQLHRDLINRRKRF